jgi:hypothetical protein
VRDLWEDEGGEGGGLRGDGAGVLAEDGRVVRDARAGAVSIEMLMGKGCLLEERCCGS